MMAPKESEAELPGACWAGETMEDSGKPVIDKQSREIFLPCDLAVWGFPRRSAPQLYPPFSDSPSLLPPQQGQVAHNHKNVLPPHGKILHVSLPGVLTF